MVRGVKLAKKVQLEWPDHDIDVVIPVPDTSRVAGAELAALLGVHYREGFIKNRYIGRTFIMPGQAQRKKSVRQKLNPVELEFRGKNVLLVDDSIVRGTTSKETSGRAHVRTTVTNEQLVCRLLLEKQHITTYLPDTYMPYT